ncbi:hypothetical protein CIPAW_12G054700 [Carya illinoinensis]|uniref:Uncharacterized protein n=1 Tax=Carya illinoinensis TaxID=32201 RepID=A0A8T1NT17_CARIL|nr:hypothetical protein CIPAW_12G054700 [Carya illinoinensis]
MVRVHPAPLQARLPAFSTRLLLRGVFVLELATASWGGPPVQVPIGPSAP